VGAIVNAARSSSWNALPGHIAHVQPQEATYARVRAPAHFHRSAAVIEVQLVDDRSIEDNQRLRSGRLARVFQPVFGIDYRLYGSDQNRHVLGTTSGHDAIDRNIPDRRLTNFRLAYAQDLVGGTVGEFKEFFHSAQGRRDDGQTIGPLF